MTSPPPPPWSRNRKMKGKGKVSFPSASPSLSSTTPNLDNNKSPKSNRVHLANRGLRGTQQQRVDAVDIGKPTRWLHHEASAAIKLRREAQNNLQLLEHGREKLAERGLRAFHPAACTNIRKAGGGETSTNRPPHKERLFEGSYRREGALSDVFSREVEPGGRLQEAAQQGYGLDLEGRVLRVGRSSEVLPWGAWPVRLKNHTGQDFYRDLSRDDPQLAGACTVGSEDEIHDHLLRRSLAVPTAPGEGTGSSTAAGSSWGRSAPAIACSSFPAQGAEQSHTGKVKRLLPSAEHGGGWIEASPPPLSDAAPVTAVPDGTTPKSISRITQDVDCDATDSAKPSVGSDKASSGRSSVGTSGQDDGKLKRLEPGWYGGWVEVDAPISTSDKRRKAHPWGNEDPAVTSDSSRGPGAADTIELAGDIGPQRPPKRARRATSEPEMDRIALRGEGECGDYNGHRQCHDASDGGEQACALRGWTVSEPAKEAVRRVWARATRRGKDAGDPRFVSSNRAVNRENPQEKNVDGASYSKCSSGNPGRESGNGDDEFDFQDPYLTLEGEEEENEKRDQKCRESSRAGGDGHSTLPAVRETLDPVLLACLGRECEGIIDAALQVVLGDRLRRSTTPGPGRRPGVETGAGNAVPSSAPTAAASAASAAGGKKLGTGEDTRTTSQSLLPSPPQSNWEDVLRAMAQCSSAARNGGALSAGGVPGDLEGSDSSGGAPPGGLARSEGGVGEAAMTMPPMGEKEGIRSEGRTVAAGRAKVWGAGDSSDGGVVVVNENLPALPLNDAVLTRSYNRLLLYLHEKRPIFAYRKDQSST